ncbi:AbrB/MazE/SpoVT family DNA-binding domain-containing protein [Staphylospora marina]|uniref:AbrB/MazE/SpoVT family DNA-binding domain-containing protein n=1 Tax=Staphylospora marina TaxID=2490858 RepID=UPI000F5BC7C3|nr:AbrB/MazE/SpoVT family DNA-binding domain-containing protein [Staphylospora marina]
MKGIGIVRKVDHLGRIVLPKELRDALRIHPHDGVEILVDNDSIILQKYLPRCVICEAGQDRQLYSFKNKIICETCVEDTARVVLSRGQEPYSDR